MSGYLRRLARPATGPDGQTAPLRPLVRSASPIRDLDQRLGVAGFEDLDGGIAAPTARDEIAPSVGESGSPGLSAPLSTPARPAAGVVQRKMAPPPNVSNAPAPRTQPSPTAGGGPAAAGALGGDPPSASGARPRPETRVSPLAPAQNMSAAVPSMTVSAPAVDRSVTPRQRLVEGRPPTRTPPASTRGAAAGEHTPLPRVRVETRTVETERDVASANLSRGGEDMPSERFKTPGPAPAEPPAREIHHHHTVERETVEQAPREAVAPVAPATPPRPLSAESVSQIGPLRPRHRSNLRFALRQR